MMAQKKKRVRGKALPGPASNKMIQEPNRMKSFTAPVRAVVKES